MPRYVVTTRREALRRDDLTASAREAVSSEPGVALIEASNPNLVTIDTDSATASELQRRLKETHIVEPEIHRDLE